MLHTELILAAILLTPMLLLSGLVSGSETALFGIRHPARARLAHTNPTAAHSVTQLLSYPRHLLTALLALNNLINVTYFAVSSVLVLGLEKKGATAAAAALGIGSLIAIILVGEIAAKLLANAQTVAFCRIVATPWIVVIRGAWPLWNGLDRFVLRPLVRLASSTPSSGQQPTAQDLAAVLTSAAADPTQPATDQKLLAQIINLRQRVARDAMQPRVELPTLTLDVPAERLEAALKDHHRVLITDANGRPIGWLSAIRYFSANAPAAPALRTRLIEQPLYIPELATLDAALRQLRQHAKDRAVVVDERGELEGVIRIEDIVATLVELSADQAADEAEQPQLVALGVFEIPGRWPARALLADLNLAHDQIDRLLNRVSTVGGLALALLGKVPQPGDTVELPGATLTVTETQGRVVARVEVRFHNLADTGPETQGTSAEPSPWN